MGLNNKGLYGIGPDDEAEVHQLLCIPQVYRYLTDGAEPPRSLTSDWIAAAVGHSADIGGGIWGLRFSDQRAMLGVVRLADAGRGELELTYLLHPDLWGRGLATRMAHAAMQHAFGTGRVPAIWAGADEPNTASISVMKRLGMMFRRKVKYPAGAGVEYVMEAAAFDGARFELLPID